MLVLFDIDHTLLDTSGAGARVFEEAGRGLFGSSFTFEGVDFAGRLDPLIVRELLAHNGIEQTLENQDALKQTYIESITGALEQGPAAALAGAHALVDAVVRGSMFTTGLLTGNYETSGRAKLRACGFDDTIFEICCWGDDSPHEPPARDHLPPVALERWGRPGDAHAAVVLGDTVHDVQCAKSNGLRCLAVATGRYSAEQLGEAGADLVLGDLTDTERIMRWLAGGRS
ncbi:MAG: HAD hydrolase-like protein [Planctomycetota bacterium]